MSVTSQQVAEKVMGWHEEWNGVPNWRDEDGFYQMTVKEWNPVENLEHAWEVVDKLREKYVVDLVGPRSPKEWSCAVETEKRGQVAFQMGATAQIAICMAALEAVGEL